MNTSGGPSDKAGIQAQDIIVRIEEQPVQRFEELISHLFNETAPGQRVALQILRNRDELTLDVTLIERPTGLTEEQTGAPEGGISVAQAIAIAREKALGADLLTTIESVSAQRETLDSGPAWIVTLVGDGGTATVTVDATTGEVLELRTE